MTANQINYQKNIETERSNREQEKLSRQKMWNDWMIANLQAQTAAANRETEERINTQKIQSQERMDYYNRGQSWETHMNTLNYVDVPKVDVAKQEADTHAEQVKVSKAKLAFDFAGNLLNTGMKLAGGGIFGALFG